MKVKPQRLIILGTGFAAFSLVKKINTDIYQVTVVSPRNYLLFTPLLASTTVGTIEFRSIIEPIRTVKAHIQFYQAICTGIDSENNIIHCEGVLDGKCLQLRYDLLVIAVGAVSNTYGIPGVLEYTKPLKELSDARAIRQRIIDCFELASTPGLSHAERQRLLNFVVVGGGPTGVEFAAEIHDFLIEDLRRWFPDLINDVNITLIEAAKGILSSFDEELSREAMKTFKSRRILVRTDCPVKEIRESEIILQDESIIPFGLAVWSTGNGPTVLVESLQFPKCKMSHLLTDEYLCVLGTKNIFSIGDCATIKDQELPETAQVAQQQGTYLANALNRKAKDQIVSPFSYRYMGMLAYIGRRRALADFKNMKLKGLIIWIFWRAIYLTKLVSRKNKILVIFDWFKTSLFGRDISRF